MKKFISIILFLFIIFSSFAATNQNIKYIFISTKPYGADVYINEKRFEYKSPIILKENYESGEYNVRIEKKGYSTYYTTIKIDRNKRFYDLQYNLIPDTLSFVMDGPFTYQKGDEQYGAPFEILDLESGVYSITLDENGNFTIQNYFYQNRLLFASLTISSYILGGVFGFVSFGISGTIQYLLSGFFLGTGTLSAIFWTYGIFSYDTNNVIVNKDYKEDEDYVFYDTAISYIGQQKYEEADGLLSKLILEYPDSLYVPAAFFYKATIYKKQKDYAKAIFMLENLISNTGYPVYEWYDLALYEIADIYTKLKKYEKSNEYYNNILFLNEDMIIISDVKRNIFFNYYNALYNQKNLDSKKTYFNEKLKESFDYFEDLDNTDYYRLETYYYYSMHLIRIKRFAKAKVLLEFLIDYGSSFSNEAYDLYQSYYETSIEYS